MDHQNAAAARTKSVPRASMGGCVATQDVFQQFLRDQHAKSAQVGNLSDRKAAWLKQVDALYTEVLRLLDEHIQSRAITWTIVGMSVNEDLLGTYEVPSLVLTVGTANVQFKPIGTYLIGSPGRVDMEGLRSTIRFVLTTPETSEPTLRGMMMGESRRTSEPIDVAAYVWKISTNPPRIKYFELTREALEKAIIEAVNG